MSTVETATPATTATALLERATEYAYSKPDKITGTYNDPLAAEFEDDELFIKLDESAERGVALDKGEPGRAVSVELEISKGTQNRKGEDNVDTFVLNQDGLTLSSVNDKYRTPLLSVGENGEFVAADGIGEKREKRARAVLNLIGLRFEQGDDN